MSHQTSRQPYQTPELKLENRVLALTLFLIVFGVMVFKLGLELDHLDRRMTAIETTVRRIDKLHEVP